MGAASLGVTMASLALSAAVLGLSWAYLRELESTAPIWWSLSGVCLCAALNIAGQALALFGLFVPGRARRLSLWATVLGIAGLAVLLVGIIFTFWARGLLG